MLWKKEGRGKKKKDQLAWLDNLRPEGPTPSLFAHSQRDPQWGGWGKEGQGRGGESGSVTCSTAQRSDQGRRHRPNETSFKRKRERSLARPMKGKRAGSGGGKEKTNVVAEALKKKDRAT